MASARPPLGTPRLEPSLGPTQERAARQGSCGPQTAGAMGLPPNPIPLTQVGRGRRHLVETLDGWAAPWIQDARGVDFLDVANWRLRCIAFVTTYLTQPQQAELLRALQRRNHGRNARQIAEHLCDAAWRESGWRHRSVFPMPELSQRRRTTHSARSPVGAAQAAQAAAPQVVGAQSPLLRGGAPRICASHLRRRRRRLGLSAANGRVHGIITAGEYTRAGSYLRSAK